LSQTSDLRQALDQVQVPTRLIWGEHDVTATPQALTSRLTDGHANRCLELIPGVGHWVGYEASQVMNARLMDFFHALPDRQP
jgi:2-hydroxy-6-oxonona-2,4-dienedioate hydrolase